MSNAKFVEELQDLRNEMIVTLHLLDNRPLEPAKAYDGDIENLKAEIKHMSNIIRFLANNFEVESLMNSLYDSLDVHEIQIMLRDLNYNGTIKRVTR